MTLVVTGASGQLGAEIIEVLAEELPHEQVVGLGHEDLELADATSVRRALAAARPRWVINTAAFHNVARCEEQPDRAFAVNASGALNLARSCASVDAGLLHLSSDYVFGDGHEVPIAEGALPAPLNVYGASKLAGEHLIAATLPRHLIVRTAGLFGAHPCRAKGGDNFVRLMLRLARERGEVKVVDDETVSPTWTRDLARQIAALVCEPHEQTGVVHATSTGACSWYDFAAEIFRLAALEPRLERARAADFGGGVRRPAYSALDNAALRLAGLDRMLPWQEALVGYLESVDEPAGAALRP